MSHSHAVKRYTGIMDWLTTVDHKKIGIMYLAGGGFFFLLAGVEAILIRIQLMFPQFNFMEAQTFNEMFTMHGTTMLFLAALPIFFGLMNYVVPLQIGARDVAFPFLNSLGLWTFLFGGILLNLSWFTGGAPDAGWTAYPTISTMESSNLHGVDYYSIGLQIAGIGTLLSAINFLVTIINMRAPGMSFMRMPLFTWVTFVTSVLILFAFTAFGIGIMLLTFERLFDTAFFNTALGGNVVLYQHIFWLFGHPEVYILILPAFGIISEVISTFSRKRLFGYSSMVFAIALIGFLGFMVWAHHMFTVGMGPIANALFGVMTMLIAVPTGIKIFNWIFTMWGGKIDFTSPMLYAASFVPTFVMGGVTGVMLSMPAADFQFHDSYFVVAHFHYVIVGGSVLGIFAGVHYWWPRMFNRKLHEGMAKFTFWTFTIGFHLTFLIQHFLGLWGMPRRIATYLEGQGWDMPNLVSSIGAFLMGLGVIVLLINVIITAKNGKPVNEGDAWGTGRTLEWAIPSPAPEYNFKQTPLVRGLDAFWKEKMEGKKEMTPAEPLGPIHMPSGSILPIFMAIGLFILGFGIIYHNDEFNNSFMSFMFNNHIVTWIGFGTLVACMIIRSLKDDPGYHIEVEELEKEVKA